MYASDPSWINIYISKKNDLVDLYLRPLLDKHIYYRNMPPSPPG
jgi:hypothetical protein